MSDIHLNVKMTEEEYRFLQSVKEWSPDGELRCEPMLHHVFMATFGQGIATATTPWDAVVAAMNNNTAMEQEQARTRAAVRARGDR